MQTYSFKKGLGKGVLSLLTVAGSIVALLGFNDVNILDFIVAQVKPLVGALTVGGVITIAINWVKFHVTE